MDWENPIIVEQSKDLEVPDFVVYNKRIKAWLEIQGDDWEDQYRNHEHHHQCSAISQSIFKFFFKYGKNHD